MAENSQIRAKGVGKDAVRHDLDGTPGLSNGSSVNSGEVGELEQGQKAISNTQGAQQAQGGGGGQPLPPAQAEQAVATPDAMGFAKQKLGGGAPAVPSAELSGLNTGQWVPMMQKIASSPDSSPLLKRAYTQMLTRLRTEAFSGSTAVVDKRQLDTAVDLAF
jgi:hypothetical protein